MIRSLDGVTRVEHIRDGMTEFQIDGLDRNDLGALLSLYDQFDRPKAPPPDEHALDRIFEQLTQSGGCVLGAFVGTALVGSCTYHRCANFSWSGRPFAILENVIVDRDHRQRGIGHALLVDARERARRDGCYKVALLTGSQQPQVHAFYRAAGFSAGKTGYQIRFD